MLGSRHLAVILAPSVDVHYILQMLPFYHTMPSDWGFSLMDLYSSIHKLWMTGMPEAAMHKAKMHKLWMPG